MKELGLWEHCSLRIFFFFFFFLRFIFREREKEGEVEGEKHQCVVASCAPPTRDLACNPGMCPDWESNQRLFGSWACAQSTELQQPGHSLRISVGFSVKSRFFLWCLFLNFSSLKWQFLIIRWLGTTVEQLYFSTSLDRKTYIKRF